MTSKFFVTSLGDIINIDSVASFRIEGEEGKKRVWYESYVYMKDGSKVPFMDISADSFTDPEDGSEIQFHPEHWLLYQECMIEALLASLGHMRMVPFQILDHIAWDKFLNQYSKNKKKKEECKTALHGE